MKPYILDIIFWCYLLYSTIGGFYLGLVNGLASILSLIAGFFAARAWGPLAMPWLDFIKDESWRVIAAYVLVFIGATIVINILAKLLNGVVKLAYLGWLNRLTGAILGFVKGVLVVSLVVFVLNILFPTSPYVTNLPGMPLYAFVLEKLQQWLPPSLAQHVNFTIM